MHPNQQNQSHLPVLAQEVLDLLNPQPGERYLDLTAGYGGHASLVLERTASPAAAVLVDRDPEAIKVLMSQFERCKIIQQDFLSAAKQLKEQERCFDMIFADLGVSSPHLDISSRGFSFANSGPLDMRMDQTQSLNAEQIVNNWSEQDLVEMLRNFGQEPKARQVAARIIQSRPVHTTEELSMIVRKAYGAWAARSRTNPATRTFQAIRIAVNDELGQIANALPLMEQLLAPGGRLAIISFHSLEDQIVKQYFAENSGDRYDADLRLLTKKPIKASKQELAINPRARSASLRAASKIKTNRKV